MRARLLPQSRYSSEQRQQFLEFIKEFNSLDEMNCFYQFLIRNAESVKKFSHLDGTFEQDILKHGPDFFRHKTLKKIRHEMFQTGVKLGAAAAGWQFASLLLFVNKAINDAVSGDWSETNAKEKGVIALYCAATGAAATLSLNLAMYSAQYLLQQCFKGQPARDLKLPMKQFTVSATVGDGLWVVANKIGKWNPLGWPEWLAPGKLSYVAEAAIFMLLQNIIHYLTVNKSSCKETKQNSFKCNIPFAATVAGANYGFDAIVATLNKLFNLDASSLKTLGTAAVGATALPVLHYSLDLLALWGLCQSLDKAMEAFETYLTTLGTNPPGPRFSVSEHWYAEGTVDSGQLGRSILSQSAVVEAIGQEAANEFYSQLGRNSRINQKHEQLWGELLREEGVGIVPGSG